MTITKLNETNNDQVRKLLEACGVNIRKDTAGRFDIECPSCKKTEAFIEYKHDKRWIKCNRDNNCGYNQSLWNLIAEKQGILEGDKVQMLEYINYLLGQNFIKTERKEPVTHSVQESVVEDQEFLNHCNQIFKNAFNQENPEVKVSWDYLNNRGYSDKNIQSFNLGYLPSSKDLLKLLIASPYNYQESKVEQLVNKYFGSILKWNSSNYGREEQCNNIGFTWYNKNNNVAGFSFRKPSFEDVKMKYVYNNGFSQSQSLFNINNYQANTKKQIVIVEGPFDALAASYLSSKEVQDNYLFVAMGGNSLRDGQAQLLQAKGISDVILLIDNDDAGENYTTSIKFLDKCNITASIARIPSEYKDIDQLLCKHPEENNILMEILNNTEQTETKVEPVQQEKPFDTHALKRKIDEGSKAKLCKTVQEKIKKEEYTKELLEEAKQYNDLLSVNYEEDNAYTNGQFLQDLQNTPSGLKTGFTELDKHVSIQPSTLNFVAGRPSHGKTTVMLNMLRNMIRDNPDKAFMFYSYEETHVDIMSKIILSCTKERDAEIEASEESYFAQAKNHLKKYAVAVVEDRKELKACPSNLHTAYQEVESWINDGRLHIMTRKPNVESLSGAIIERIIKIEDKQQNDKGEIKLNGKKVSAIFIDYVQKLNSEEEISNRQQELHKVCKDLLNTACDKRVEAAIIMGAQANREVKSLDTFPLESMREAGDIEQDANIVIGVWDEEAGKKSSLEQILAHYQKKLDDIQLIKNSTNESKDEKDLKQTLKNIRHNIKKLNTGAKSKKIALKVLKNRNGKNNVDCTVQNCSERFCIATPLLIQERANNNKSMRNN